jgi:hypothetical protein
VEVEMPERDQLSGDQSYRQSLKKTNARIGDPKRLAPKLLTLSLQDAAGSAKIPKFQVSICIDARIVRYR